MKNLLHLNKKAIENRLYAVFDNRVNLYTLFFYSPSDSVAARTAFLSLHVPLQDSELYEIGKSYSYVDKGERFDKSIKYSPSDLSLVLHKSPRLVSWSSYKLPETVAEALSPLDLSDPELKNFIQSSKVQLHGEPKDDN